MNDLADERLKIEEDVVDQLEKQKGLQNDNIQQMIELGLLDPENLRDVERIAGSLSRVGYGGLDLLSQLGSLGVSGGTARYVQIGAMNITNNEATSGQIAGNIASLIKKQLGE